MGNNLKFQSYSSSLPTHKMQRVKEVVICWRQTGTDE